MMKIIGIAIVSVALFNVVQAQHVKESQFVLKAGAAIPLGKFAGNNFMPPPAELHPDGLAQKGLSITAQYARSFKGAWGWIAAMGFQTHARNEEAMQNQVLNTWVYGAPASVDANGKRWNIFKFMVGGYYQNLIQQPSPWTIRPEILLGITKTDLPGYSYVAYSNNIASASGTQINLPLKVALSYQVNLDLQYALSSTYFVSMDLSFYHARPWMEYQYYPNFPQSFNLVTGKKRHYDLSTAALQCGIGMKF